MGEIDLSALDSGVILGFCWTCLESGEGGFVDDDIRAVAYEARPAIPIHLDKRGLGGRLIQSIEMENSRQEQRRSIKKAGLEEENPFSNDHFGVVHHLSASCWIIQRAVTRGKQHSVGMQQVTHSSASMAMIRSETY